MLHKSRLLQYLQNPPVLPCYWSHALCCAHYCIWFPPCEINDALKWKQRLMVAAAADGGTSETHVILRCLSSTVWKCWLKRFLGRLLVTWCYFSWTAPFFCVFVLFVPTITKNTSLQCSQIQTSPCGLEIHRKLMLANLVPRAPSLFTGP